MYFIEQTKKGRTNMYKLVAIDLDGTLVTDEKELTKKRAMTFMTLLLPKQLCLHLLFIFKIKLR